MYQRNKKGLLVLLFLLVGGLMFASVISSCGKPGVNNANLLNIQYQVANLSPDLGPVSLYIDYRIYNNLNFFYPIPSGYFALASIDTPFQIRPSPNIASGTTVVNTYNIFSRNDVLKPHFKYTLFVTGLKSDSSLTSVLLTDTANSPTIGRGKVRFMHASPRSAGFDIYANGALAFKNATYTNVTAYKELPAGNYSFQIYPTGTDITSPTAGSLGGVQNVTIQDGRAYTVYSRGLAGRTDTLAFGAGVLVNK